LGENLTKLKFDTIIIKIAIPAVGFVDMCCDDCYISDKLQE